MNDSSDWISVKDELPKSYEEVLVLVDGHRGPMWSNSYILVAYLNAIREWREERHPESDPITGVVRWKRIESGLWKKIKA